MRKKLLILGSTSRIGQMLRSLWRDRADIAWSARAGAGSCWSLEDGADALAQQLRTIDTVLCLAGATPRGGADWDLNRRIATEVVRAASGAGARAHVFLASSMAVYGAGPGPHAETAALAPVGAYGASKAAMEAEALAEAARLGVGATALRLGNVVGADLLGDNIAAGRPIVLDRFGGNGGGGAWPVRSYVDPARLAMILDRLARMPRGDLPPVLNLASDPPLSMADLAVAAGTDFQERPAPASALPRVAMDLRLLCRLVPEAAEPCDAAGAVAGWRSASGPS